MSPLAEARRAGAGVGHRDAGNGGHAVNMDQRNSTQRQGPPFAWLVSDWRLVWRFWSTRLTVVAIALLGWPEPLLMMWSWVTPEAREVMPRALQLGIPLGLLVLAIGAKYIRQKVPDAGR